ncbi:MAG: carboxypeptidase regulatory-like domain-containing protein, partial [Bacteroidota bacterium]
YFEDVEGYEPFLTEDIDRWTVVDQDGKATVFPAGVTFPHAGEPASFMTFNRTLTTPPLSEVYWGAHSGNQYFASFGSQQGATSNWLISEEQDHTVDYTLSFYAKSITENYGLETFRVGYSTTTNQLSDFIFLTTNETALTYWTKFSYTIPADAKYVAIRHNHTGFALLIDDITLGVIDDNAMPAEGFTVYLDGEEAETGLMDTEYVFENLVPGTYTAGVQANYYTGSSNIMEKEFTMQQGTPVTFVVEDNLGNLIEGASISIYYEGALVYTDVTTGGMANFQLYPGSYAYEVSAEELSTVSGNMEVTENPLEVNVVLNNFYDLQFVVSNSNGDLIDGATVMFDGQTQTTVAGYTTFVTAPGEFAYSVTHPDYAQVFSLLNVTADHTEEVTLPEITCEAPVGLSYEKDNNDVTLTWSEPVIGENGTWLHWDNLFDGVSIGTGGPVDFDVAQRFAVEDLQAHQNKFLTRVLFVPSEAACEYSIRVWTGGNIGAPETLVVDQVVENPVIDQWNEIFLETPVFVDGTEELWIGFRSNTTTGHPAGCDIGPAVDGKGNMINLAGTGWQTLLEVNPQMDYNWSVRGLIEEPANPARFENIAIVAEQPVHHAKHYFLESSQRIVEGFGEPRQLLGYNLYRNSEIQNAALIVDTSYFDADLSAGAYLYEVTAVYSNGCESAASNAVNVMIGSTVYNPPQNLIVEVNMDDVSLQWDAPAAPGEWLHFDNGENFEGIGLSEGGSFRVAARWTPDMLNAYPGSVISSLKLFPRSTGDAGFTVKIWKGENAVDLLYEQALENLSQDAWNTVTLDTPVAIDNTQELWVGYEVDHVAGDYPAGTDAGPAIAGFGDMVSLDGATWEMLSDYGMDYNWNVQVLVSPDNGMKAPEQILPNNPPQQINKPGTLVAGNLPMADKPQTSGDFLPDGYYVYRDNQRITGAPVQELYYVDYSVEPGTHIYFVTAVYGQNESEPSNVAEILVQGDLGKILGFVRDAETNIGIGAATITAVNADNGSLTKTTPFGSHYTMMLMPGNYDVTCIAEGYEPETVTGLPVIAGQNTPHTFYLQPQVDYLASVHEAAGESLRIYPNPSNGKVYIVSNKLKSIVITSIDGQIIHQAEAVADHYAVDHLPGGMYIVKAVTRSGTVFCEKLIVH